MDIELTKVIGKKLPKSFYMQDCLKAAKELIGKVLVHKTGDLTFAGIIVETEAYLGDIDAASHSFNGMTERNAVMFDSGGLCYVYFTYGNHYCMNVVIGEKNTAHAVLIRALEPVAGIERMKKNRSTDDIFNLTSGPGKLTAAIGIDKTQNGSSFLGNRLYIAESKRNSKPVITASVRIGISRNTEKKWRFYSKQSPFVSGLKKRDILRLSNQQ